ncbi:hypothetical protein [Paenibacillus koleovorans]|uniref:hypothetical protein n=1 Tax=Paenibacillus koleovorans TaxID=121608 RepID=UPI000FDA9AF2|nr:hypothetical protein [Paenibacillus koleovorans]
MRKWLLLIVLLGTLVTGCKADTEPEDFGSRPVKTELSKSQGLENWNLVMIPKSDLLGKLVYDIEFQYTGEPPAKSVVVYYRIDTEEKLKAPTVKADSKTVVSTLSRLEKITLSELVLPIDTPISVEVDWFLGNQIKRGTGVFTISEHKY